MAAGQEIYTVEALAARGELGGVQQAMAAGGGSQCGYCTPGFVMSLFAEQYRPGRTRPLRSARAGRQSVPLHRLSSDSRCRAIAGPPRRPDRFRERLSRPAACDWARVDVRRILAADHARRNASRCSPRIRMRA